MLLYRFLPERWALESLRTRRLKISLINELNDPFELLAVNLRSRELRRAFGALKDQLSQTTGLLCFSKRWANPLLWTHYADRSRGICLGFKIPESRAESVAYEAERITLTEDWFSCSEKQRLETVKRILRTKFSNWEYEEEYRCFLKLSDRDERTSHYFADFNDDLRLAEIIVGLNCAVQPEALFEAIGDNYKAVQIIKARMAFKAYAVVKDKRGFSADRRRSAA
jgi:hypothetical protein